MRPPSSCDMLRHNFTSISQSKHVNMLDHNTQALREQIISNSTLLFFLHRGSKDGFSDPIIAMMRNGKDTSAGVVAIKGDNEIITLVDDVSAPSDIGALQAVFERSKIDLALAMSLAKENRESDFADMTNGD